MHNQIRVRSFKNYTQETLIEELRKLNFPDYNIFSNVNIAYKDLVNCKYLVNCTLHSFKSKKQHPRLVRQRSG